MLIDPMSCGQNLHDGCEGVPCECGCHLPPMTVREIQQTAWRNKLAKGFNVTDVPLEFCLLSGEVAEAFAAWRIGHVQEFGAELADIAIYLAGIAEITGVDLQAAVQAKLTENAARTYRVLPNGTHVKAGAQ